MVGKMWFDQDLLQAAIASPEGLCGKRQVLRLIKGCQQGNRATIHG